MHSNWKASLVSRHISSPILLWHWQQDSVTCSLTSSYCQITSWDTEVGMSSFFCAAVAQAPNEIRALSLQARETCLEILLALSTHCPTKEGKVGGEAEILKKEVTCLRLQRKPVAEAGPKELSECCSATRDLDLRDKHEWGISSLKPVSLGRDEFLTLIWHFKLHKTLGLLLLPRWPLGSRVGCAVKGSPRDGGRLRHKMLEQSIVVWCHQQNPKFQPSHMWDIQLQAINGREERRVTPWWSGTGTSHSQDDFRQIAPICQKRTTCLR